MQAAEVITVKLNFGETTIRYKVKTFSDVSQPLLHSRHLLSPERTQTLPLRTLLRVGGFTFHSQMLMYSDVSGVALDFWTFLCGDKGTRLFNWSRCNYVSMTKQLSGCCEGILGGGGWRVGGWIDEFESVYCCKVKQWRFVCVCVLTGCCLVFRVITKGPGWRSEDPSFQPLWSSFWTKLFLKNDWTHPKLSPVIVFDTEVFMTFFPVLINNYLYTSFNAGL